MNKKIVPLICVLSLGTSMAFAATNVNPSSRKTADSQVNGTATDVEVTRRIRDRLTDMDDLSMRAQNVTIVTVGKNVTLKGEVERQDEIQSIMNVTQEVAVGKNISNQLRVHK